MSKLSKKTALAQVLAQKISTSEDIVMEKAIHYKKDVGQLKLTINKVQQEKEEVVLQQRNIKIRSMSLKRNVWSLMRQLRCW